MAVTHFLVGCVLYAMMNVVVSGEVITDGICYSKQMFPRKCMDNQKFLIHQIAYGAKQPLDDCLSDVQTYGTQNASCCTFSPGDCSVPMQNNETAFFYEKLSGYSDDNGRVGTIFKINWERVDPSSCALPREYTNYGYLTSDCVSDKSVVNLASDAIFITKSKGYVFYSGQNNDQIPSCKNCTCRACADHGKLNVYSVDVRLRNADDSGSYCRNNHTIVITGSNHTEILTCRNETFYRYKQWQFPYNDKCIDITLEIDITSNTVPQMVWFGIEGVNSDSLVEIICNEGVAGLTSPKITDDESTRNISSNSKNVAEKGSDDLLLVYIIAPCAVVVIIICIISIVVYRRRQRLNKEKREKVFANFRQQLREENSKDAKSGKTNVKVTPRYEDIDLPKVFKPPTENSSKLDEPRRQKDQRVGNVDGKTEYVNVKRKDNHSNPRHDTDRKASKPGNSQGQKDKDRRPRNLENTNVKRKNNEAKPSKPQNRTKASSEGLKTDMQRPVYEDINLMKKHRAGKH